MSISQPLHSQISLRNQESSAIMTMGEALGITDRGSVKKINDTCFDSNQPLDKLLENKRFRTSFMSFADSCLAGESVHFYEEVYDLKETPVDDSIRRIYMARHIIEKYIDAGAEMEINISHRTRQEILGTPDLTDPNLFDSAVGEILQLIKMNLAKDYWSSLQFAKLKEEIERGPNGRELMPSDYSPRVLKARAIQFVESDGTSDNGSFSSDAHINSLIHLKLQELTCKDLFLPCFSNGANIRFASRSAQRRRGVMKR